MVGIILSAGKGERLLHYTKNKPKVLLDINGITILDNIYFLLTHCMKFESIYLGAGHCIDAVEEYVAKKNLSKIKIVYNPFYKISGPLVTLWLVLNYIDDDDFIFMNGDTLFSKKVFTCVKENILNVNEGIYLVCSMSDNAKTDDVKVMYDDDGNIIAVGKDIENYNAISAGMVVVKGKRRCSTFKLLLDKVSKTDDFVNFKKTWHSFLNDIIAYGNNIKPIFVDQSEWYEIDRVEDIEKLQFLIQKDSIFNDLLNMK